MKNIAKNNEDVLKILRSEHHDPFSVLGVHIAGHRKGTMPSVAVRAFLPEAKEVYVTHVNNKPGSLKMNRICEDGFFEAIVKGVSDITSYKLKVVCCDGTEYEKYDPYSFLPIISEMDMHLFSEGNHQRIFEKLGANIKTINGISGVLFGVWAPNAKRVSIIGDFNCWDGRRHPMRNRGSSGIWELFIPGLVEGDIYKFEIKTQNDDVLEKTDPYAFYAELRPKTAGIVFDHSKYEWRDESWVSKRDSEDPINKPISIYEVHLGSWMRNPEDNGYLSYKDLAHKIVDYVTDMGYTHIELMPVAEFPFDGSWGYQVTCYYAPTSRFGDPDGFKYFIDHCHENGIGVIVDWVPAHFPKDGHSLISFDGTSLYEHADPKQAEHKDWGTMIFNYGRNEVRNFLTANVLFWMEKFHIDGIRVDAVASMLYLDYSKGEGEWIPNQYGGRENLEAIFFLRRMNELIHAAHPGILSIAEESTAYPAVSRPTYLGGLGFTLKWNMGWMNDILEYFEKEPIHRKYHHNNLTFALLYAFHENFTLVVSHDEVVHGKKSLLDKMPGDMWQKFANVRLLWAYMYSQPGKKLNFMGNDIGQWIEWQHDHSLDWHLLEFEPHKKLQSFVRELNNLYKNEPAMWEVDFSDDGFEWVDFHDWEGSLVSFLRKGKDPEKHMFFVFNFTPVPRENYRIGVPHHGYYKEVLNSDSDIYGGSGVNNDGGLESETTPWQGQPFSLSINVPPLSALIFKPC